MTCEYCHEDRDGYIVPIEKNCHAYLIYPDKLMLKFDREHLECKINYCPMCGRKLKPGKSPCYTCANKNVYEPLLKCYVCNYAGIECNNRDFPMYRQKECIISEPPKEET